MYAQQFDRDGYVHIKDALDPQELLTFRKFILSELARKNVSLLTDSAIEYEPMRQFLTAPKLIAALTEVLGSHFIVLPPTSVDHNRFGQFHTDLSAMEMTGRTFHKDPDFRAVVLGIYLQDNGPHGGGLRLVPGTHRLPDRFVKKLADKRDYRNDVTKSRIKSFIKHVSGNRLFTWKDPDADDLPNQIDVPTKIGDAMFWDMGIIHRASPKTIQGEAMPGGKVALFYTIGRDNKTTRKWIDYLTETGEIEKVRQPGRPPMQMPQFSIL